MAFVISMSIALTLALTWPHSVAAAGDPSLSPPIDYDWPNPLGAPFVPPCLALHPEERKFLELINEYRVQNRKQALYVSIRLTDAARWLVEDGARTGYFSHVDRLGRGIAQRITDFGYQLVYFSGTRVGENILWGSGGAANQAMQAFMGWKSSAVHNENMLSKRYWHIGIARFCATGECFWVTDFGGNRKFHLTDNCNL